MTSNIRTLLLAGVFAAGVASFALAQSASTIGSGAASTTPTGSSATGGTAGSAAVGGTSASTIGAGGTSTGSDGTSSSIGGAGSAAGGTKDTSSTKIGGNDKNLHEMSKARAQDGGTWSDSKTKTKIHKGEVSSTTKSMAHQPGGPPVKSTTGVSSGGQ
jgi:hypothetical protein